MIPVSDIEAVIKILKSKLPKVDNGADPNTYYAGCNYGERSAYSDTIQILKAIVKIHKA